MRELLFNTERELLNVKESVSIQRHCVQFVTKYQWQAIMPKYAELYVDMNAFEGIRMMLDGIKEEFVMKLKNNKWMSDHTRTLTIEKISRIKYFLGYPEGTRSVADFEVRLRFCSNLIVNVGFAATCGR